MESVFFFVRYSSCACECTVFLLLALARILWIAEECTYLFHLAVGTSTIPSKSEVQKYNQFTRVGKKANIWIKKKNCGWERKRMHWYYNSCKIQEQHEKSPWIVERSWELKMKDYFWSWFFWTFVARCWDYIQYYNGCTTKFPWHKRIWTVIVGHGEIDPSTTATIFNIKFDEIFALSPCSFWISLVDECSFWIFSVHCPVRYYFWRYFVDQIYFFHLFHRNQALFRHCIHRTVYLYCGNIVIISY